MAKKHGYAGSYIFLDAELKQAVPGTDAIKAFYQVVRSAVYRAGFYTYQFMYSSFHKSVFTSSDGVWAAAYPLGAQATSVAPNFNYFPSVDNCIAWQFTDNWKGMKIDGSICLTDDLTKKATSQSTGSTTNAEYYRSILKRVRLKQTTKIYKDKYLDQEVRSYPKGEEFELVPEKPFTTGSGATRYRTESGFYITGNMDYVDSIYYLAKEYSGKKTIELKREAKIYKDKEFEQPVRSYPKGTQFKVVENVALSSGRRCFKIESGHYITANKDYSKFV